MAAEPLDEFERLRRMVNDRADFHLHNWGVWSRSEHLTDGYADHSTCLENMGGCAAEESSDHVYERHLGRWAEIADTVIYKDMQLRERMLISNIYEASVLRFRGDTTDEFIEAVAEFWRHAIKKGLA